MLYSQECICALATPPGLGAIALIRVSGDHSIELVNEVFIGKNLTKVKSHTIHFGLFKDGDHEIDEVLVSVFKTPNSFTKEDSVEISCHGSSYIIQSILKVLIRNGCRMAEPGEFTKRAYLNGRFDLVQAEAVSDLIHADSAAAHKTAFSQIRGGFSRQLASLRELLIHFASMIELELDFGEEDVEFANRNDLKKLVTEIICELDPLLVSFDSGNAVKEGLPVAIIGPPNAGKSTLLNALLNDEKAIVTEIAGTTRDVIEDVVILEGIKFRFIDTAGIRETTDLVESIGIERSKQALDKASIVLFLFENDTQKANLLAEFENSVRDKRVLLVRNKIDLALSEAVAENEFPISAKTKLGLAELQRELIAASGLENQNGVLVTNLRHYQQLLKTKEALQEVLQGLDQNITGDFLAQDIRLALHHLGEITGTITTDDLLANIFSRFCIGK